MLQDRLELSERRACRVTGQHRSTQRRLPTRGRGDDELRTELHAFSHGHPRWGYRPAVGDIARGGLGRESQAGTTALARGGAGRH